ncbi:MAG: AMP-binding protein [Lentisphaeria bacterium]|nr:AMP-binding protein [Lentisphaeria bacterium]
MDNKEMISMRVRELRAQKNFTVEQMAELLGVSPEEYTTYESGAKQAPFSFYYNLAEHFGMDVSSVISGEAPNLALYTVTRSGEGFPFVRRPEFSYLHQAIRMKDRTGEPFIVTAPPPADPNAPLQYSEHNGQEFVLILSGSLKVFLHGKEELLNEGDSIYFDGREAHAMVADGGKPCRFLSIVMHSKYDDAKPDRFAFVPQQVVKQPPTGNKRLLYQDYMEEEWNPDGTLKGVKFHVPDDFNFAFDVVNRLAAECPDKIAMKWVSKDKVCHDFTFRDISENSMRAANLLHSLGIRKGDRVMLVLKRHYQFWFVLNALHMIGAVAVPASCQMTAHDFEYRFKKADVRYVICSADGNITKEVDEAAAVTGMTLKLSVNGQKDGWLDFDALYPNFPPVFQRPADHKTTDTMLVFFSSGTTGYPKMVEHDYSYPLGHIMTARHWHKVNPDGLHFTVADTGWGKALWGKIYGQWLCEAGVFTFDFDRFHAADMLPMFKQYGITTFCAPPTIFRFLVKEDLSQVDFSTLEHVTTAGEAMPAEVSEAFARVSGQLPYEGFGQTETTLLIGTLADMKPRPGSMGRPNPQFQVVLLDPEGNPVKTGDTGEICVKATPENHPCGLFHSYLKSPEDTAKVWHDGYYHTGDQAWQDEDGYFWYQGRADDIIKTSGYRVGPFEVESVLMELPYILECAVTGVPDPVRGKVVKATIVLVKGKEASDELKEEIKNYVKTHTAPYKYPRIIEFVAELPKTVNGKIRRAAIREQNNAAGGAQAKS